MEKKKRKSPTTSRNLFLQLPALEFTHLPIVIWLYMAKQRIFNFIFSFQEGQSYKKTLYYIP